MSDVNYRSRRVEKLEMVIEMLQRKNKYLQEQNDRLRKYLNSNETRTTLTIRGTNERDKYERPARTA